MFLFGAEMSASKVIAKIENFSFKSWLSAVPSLRGGQAGRAPLTTACASPFWFTQNTLFGASRKGKTTDKDGRKNNYGQT